MRMIDLIRRFCEVHIMTRLGLLMLIATVLLIAAYHLGLDERDYESIQQRAAQDATL